MEIEFLETSNFESITHEAALTKCAKMLEFTKNLIFESFSRLFREKKKNSPLLNFNQKFAYALSNLIVSLQILRFNWGTDFKAESYAEAHWKALGYANLDQICAYWGILDVYFIIYNCLNFLLVASLIILAIRSYKNTEFLSHFIKISSAILCFISTFGFIPGILIFMQALKNSAMNKSETSEYGSCSNCNLNFGVIGIFISLINLFLMAFLVYGNEIFQAELRHTFAFRNLKSRAHSMINIDLMSFSFILPIIYVSLSDFSPYFHQIVLIVFPFYIILKIIKYKPYYNSFSNIVIIARNLWILLTTISFIIGKAIDDSLIPIIFFWIVNPILLYIVLNYISKKIKNSRKNSCYSNQYEFENNLRSVLMSESIEDPIKVLNDFETALQTPLFKADKLFIIWQANYCLYALKNERLARIKLNKIFCFKSTIEGHYQEWAICHHLEKNNIGKYEDIGSIFYFLELEMIKSKDKILCNKLADFWKEIVASKPNYDRLEVLANHVSINLDAVNKRYSCLTKKFPNRTACHDLYGTLQINILRKQEIGSAMLLQKGSLASTNLQENKTKSLPFSDSNGFLIISADKDSLGFIVYANSVAASILNQPINDIVKSHLTTYVPYPYSIHHDKYLTNFITSCVDPEEAIGMSHFLQTERGYLVESNFELHFVSLIKHIYFVAIMKPMRRDRECAVLSNNGMIYAHSELFLQYIDCPKLTGRGENMNDLVPNFDYSQLKIGTPLFISHNNRTILFVLKQITKKSTTFNLLLLIHRKEEIEEWSKGGDEWQKDLEESWPSSFEFKDVYSKEKLINREEIDEENIEYQNFIEKDKLETVASPALNGSSQSSSASLGNIYLVIGEKMTQKTQIVLKSIKWSLLIAIIIIISINLGILMYIWAKVNHSDNLTNISHLASLLQHVTVLAHLSRNIDLASESSFLNKKFYLESFQTSINTLDSLHQSILFDYEKWEYCSSSDVVHNKIIPMWTRNASDPDYYNLYDMTTNFIQHGKYFLNSFNKESNYQDDEFFLIVNSIGKSYKILNDSLTGLIECEINRIKDSDKNIAILFAIGFSVIGFYSASFFIMISNLHRKYNSIWNFIRKYATYSYNDLIKSCFERLKTIHGSDDGQQISKKMKQQKSMINEKFSKKFSIFCSIIILISFLQNFLVGYALYPSAKQNLINRYQLLEAYYNNVGQISEACFWISELSFGKNSSSDSLLNNFYGFSSANDNIFDIIKRYQKTLHITLSKNYRELFSTSLKKQVFESIEDALDPYFDLGMYSASLTLSDEMSFYAFSDIEDVEGEINRFFVRAWNLQNLIIQATPLFISGSKSYVNSQVNYIIYMAIFFGIFYFLSYFLFYRPAIIRESDKMRKLFEISQLVPR